MLGAFGWNLLGEATSAVANTNYTRLMFCFLIL